MQIPPLVTITTMQTLQGRRPSTSAFVTLAERCLAAADCDVATPFRLATHSFTSACVMCDYNPQTVFLETKDGQEESDTGVE